MKIEFQKEDCSGEGGKGVPMDTSASTTSGMKMEDRKPDIKKEVKDEEESSETVTQQPVKKKSKGTL